MAGTLSQLAARVRRTRIVIFAKAPVPGRAKTRLIPALGEVGAARLAHRMLLDTAAQAVAAELATPELCADPHPPRRATAAQAAGFRLSRP